MSHVTQGVDTHSGYDGMEQKMGQVSLHHIPDWVDLGLFCALAVRNVVAQKHPISWPPSQYEGI